MKKGIGALMKMNIINRDLLFKRFQGKKQQNVDIKFIVDTN